MGKELFFALVIICTVTHINRSVYEILKHKQILKPGKLSFVIMFANMMLLWISWVLLWSRDLYRISIPDIIRYSGLALSGIGLVLFLTALFTIKTLESYNGDLITTGTACRASQTVWPPASWVVCLASLHTSPVFPIFAKKITCNDLALPWHIFCSIPHFPYIL